MTEPPVPRQPESALERLASCASTVEPACGSSTVIAVDGRAGSGKSTWGDLLATRLGCPLVRMEDLYPGWQGLEAGIDVLLDEVLSPLAAGAVALVPRWDWHSSRWAEPAPLGGGGLVIVEGVGSAAARVGHLLSLIVWLECDEPTRRQRALSRVEDGEAFAAEWTRWADQEEALLARDRTPDHADCVLDTSGDAISDALTLPFLSGRCRA